MKEKIFACFSFLFLLSCSTQKNYTNTFSEGFLKNKTIVFTLNKESDNTIAFTGSAVSQFSNSKPNAAKAFKKAIEMLAEETHLDLQYRDTFVKSKDSEIHIDAKIIQITWLIDFDAATMRASVNYYLQNNDDYYESFGNFKNTLGGSPNDKLYKTLKNSVYTLLQEFDKNKEFK